MCVHPFCILIKDVTLHWCTSRPRPNPWKNVGSDEGVGSQSALSPLSSVCERKTEHKKKKKNWSPYRLLGIYSTPHSPMWWHLHGNGTPPDFRVLSKSYDKRQKLLKNNKLKSKLKNNNNKIFNSTWWDRFICTFVLLCISFASYLHEEEQIMIRISLKKL